MIDDKDNVIDFVEHLKAKKRAELQMHELASKEPASLTDNKQRLDELILKMAADSVLPDENKQRLALLISQTAENLNQPSAEQIDTEESFINRQLYKIVNKRYSNLTENFDNIQKDFFIKQFKAFLGAVAIMIFWFELCVPLIIGDAVNNSTFLAALSTFTSVFLYMFLGAALYGVSSHQRLLDLLQMDRVLKKLIDDSRNVNVRLIRNFYE